MTLFGYTVEFPAKPSASSKASRLADPRTNLGNVRPGEQARILGFAAGLSAERWAHLQSYGLVPGRLVRVLQHSPVTILQVEHCELALEDDLARLIEIVLLQDPSISE